jgi:hypothetical protein
LFPRDKAYVQDKPLATTFAASSATEAKEIIAKKGRHAVGSAPVKVPKQVWRPKVKMVCEEPEELLDTSGDLDWLFEEHGEVGVEHKMESPPRNDIICYDPEVHAKEIDNNICNSADVRQNIDSC